ncbi:MAG: NVEALA domain-containing protein [Dysgonamonadaceae bacterium]|jgi:hypothetical protein|nr:NVEALA domain-containing protein [Dysgonamonadaceae bacterium]
MKKILFTTFAVAVIAVAAGLNVMQGRSETALSDVALANVEALANGENPNCPNGCLADGNGCDCNGWWPCYREDSW